MQPRFTNWLLTGEVYAYGHTQIARERLINVKVTSAVESNQRYSVTLVQRYFAHWFNVDNTRTFGQR